MFTNCPSCARQFRVRAKQLAQAEGLVQCGFCGKQFSALERLYDKPLVIDDEQSAADLVEPEFFIPEITEETNVQEVVTAAPAAAPADITVDLPGLEADHPPASGPPIDEDSPVADYPFPGELANEEAPKAGMFSRLIWSFGVLLLLLAGTAQLTWFNRDFLLSQYPQFLPQAKQVCQFLNCTLVRMRNISAIKLLNRDVRVHPRYNDALLVNATMTNVYRYAQRFPTVLLSLFDTNGKVTAYRRIPATVYLDNSIDVEAGMAPNMPVHFALEVVDSGTGAVSFEFDFL